MDESFHSPPFRLQRAFTLIGFVFGQLLVLLIPPFQSADEPLHLFRAYEITEGVILHRQVDSRGVAAGNIPAGLYEIWLPFSHIGFHPESKVSFRMIRDASRIPLDPSRRIFITFPATASYCALCYLPQSIGILLGRFLNVPALAILYLAREANLLFWVLSGYFSLKWAPPIARPLFLILLLPMALYVACTTSADGPTNAFATLFTAYISGLLASRDGQITVQRSLLLAALALSVCLCKFAYLPLLLLLLLIPSGRFAAPARRWTFLMAVIFLCLSAIFLINIHSRGLDTRIALTGNISARSQWSNLCANPAQVAPLVLRTVRVKTWSVLQTFVGLIGWLDQYLPPWFVVLYLLMLLMSCAGSDHHLFAQCAGRIAAVVIPAVVASTLLIGLLSYLYWSPVGFPYVDGIHGRYFIPLSPACALLIVAVFDRAGLHSSLPPQRTNLILALFAVLSCSGLCALVYHRYYAAA